MILVFVMLGMGIRTAFRPRGAFNNASSLLARDQARVAELFCRINNSTDVLAVVFPFAAGDWAFARHKLEDAATARVHDSAGRRAGAMVRLIRDAVAIAVQRRAYTRLKFNSANVRAVAAGGVGGRRIVNLPKKTSAALIADGAAK